MDTSTAAIDRRLYDEERELASQMNVCMSDSGVYCFSQIKSKGFVLSIRGIHYGTGSGVRCDTLEDANQLITSRIATYSDQLMSRPSDVNAAYVKRNVDHLNALHAFVRQFS